MAGGWRRVGGAIVILLVSLSSVLAQSRAREGQNAVQPSILSDVSTIVPGQPFNLGVQFFIKEPWHIYWKYPGPAGLPTRISLEVPPGYKVGETGWPIPGRFTQPGDIPGYGYEQEVLFVIPVEPPGALAYGKVETITADVRWLACSDVCVPGKARLTLRLPISAQAGADNESLFAHWKARLPERPEIHALPFSVDGSMAVLSVGVSRRVALTLEWPEPPRVRNWFPLPGAGMIVSDPKLETRGNLVNLNFNGELTHLRKSESPVELGLLIEYEDSSGRIRGVETSIVLGDKGGLSPD